MRNSTQAHLRFLTLAAVHKVLKDRTEVLVLKVRWTFVSTDRSGTEIRTRERGRVSVKKKTHLMQMCFLN